MPNAQCPMTATSPITIPDFGSSCDGMRHFFGTRHGYETASHGEMAVVSLRQVHGTDVVVLDRPVQPQPVYAGEGDALVTDQRGVLLTIRTADCVPVLVHDPGRRIIAAIHAGWRGAVAEIVPKTLDILRGRFGAALSSLRIGIGPSAGPCCYEVDEPVLGPLRKVFPDWRRLVRQTNGNKAMLDLRGLVRAQAEACGVPSSQVHAVSLCTICNPALFHSYRREGVVNATMVSGIVLLP